MNKIVSKEHFSANVVKLEVEAPLIARSRKAGHFVIVKVGEKGERIPLTIAGADTTKGTITLVIQAVGGSSKKICELNAGDYITDLVGPLGQATHIEKVGTVVCAGGGVGVAPLLPIVEAFHKAGNRVIVVLAARTKDLVILEEQMRANSDEVIVMTDDGSYGTKGLVTNGVESVINREKVDLCVTIGPAVMMKFVSALTKKYETAFRTTLSQAVAYYTENEPKGECVIVIEGKSVQEIEAEDQARWQQMSLEEHMEHYESQGNSRKEAMKLVAKDRGVSKRDVYQALLEAEEA